MRVLLVEDTTDIATYAEIVWRAHGHDVQVHTDATSVDWTGPAPDVAVFDLTMPDVDGATLAARAAQAWPGVRIIIWTAAPLDEAARRLDAVGVGATVHGKPMGADQLAAMLG